MVRDAWRDLWSDHNPKLFAVGGAGFFNRPGTRIVDGRETLGRILQSDDFRHVSASDARPVEAVDLGVESRS